MSISIKENRPAFIGIEDIKEKVLSVFDNESLSAKEIQSKYFEFISRGRLTSSLNNLTGRGYIVKGKKGKVTRYSRTGRL